MHVELPCPDKLWFMRARESGLTCMGISGDLWVHMEKTGLSFRDTQGGQGRWFWDMTEMECSITCHWERGVDGLNLSLYTVKSVIVWKRWSGKQNPPHQSYYFICHVIHHVQTFEAHRAIKMLKQWWISVSNSIIFHPLKGILKSMDIQVNVFEISPQVNNCLNFLETFFYIKP